MHRGTVDLPSRDAGGREVSVSVLEPEIQSARLCHALQPEERSSSKTMTAMDLHLSYND